MKDEIWKDIHGYEGSYQVSNLGRIRSLDRLVNKNGLKLSRGKIMTPTDNGTGYCIVGLRMKGVRKNRYVHRLVAEHFLLDWDETKEIDHINYDKKDNSVGNLRVVTREENIRHSLIHRPKTRKSTRCKIEKYIYPRRGRYRVFLPGMGERQFATLEEARKYKEENLRET